MLETLREIRLILSLHGHRGQERVIARLIDLYDNDVDSFVKLVQSVEVWGGAGAVWEVVDLGSDELPFRKAIIQLAAEMERQGYGTARSRDIANVFNSWNMKGL